MLPLFVLVGVNVFESVDEADIPQPTPDGPENLGDERFTKLFLTTQLTQAVGEDRSSGFLVHDHLRPQPVS